MEETTNSILKKESKFDWKPLILLVGLIAAEAISEIFVSLMLQKMTIAYKNTIVWFVGKIIPCVIAVVVLRKQIKINFKTAFKNIGYSLIFVFLSFVIFMAMENGITYYSNLMDKLFNVGTTSNQEGIYEYFRAAQNFPNYFILFLTIVVVAPLLEEIEYRECIFKAFKGLPFWLTAIISALLFGLVHMQELSLKELSYYPVYFIPGLAFALIYHYGKNNFLGDFTIHLIINAISFYQIVIYITNNSSSISV